MLNEIMRNYNYANGYYTKLNSAFLKVCDCIFGYINILPNNIYTKYFLWHSNIRLSKIMPSVLCQINFGA